MESVCSRDMKRSQARSAIEALFEIIKQNLERGEEVLISGFGKFCVKGKNPRKGRNPITGEGLMLNSRRVVTFRCSPVLKDGLNGKSRGRNRTELCPLD
jgi:integration host factor subunit alpha